MTKKLKGALIPAVVIIIWYTGSSMGWFNSFIIPPPSRVLKTAYYLLERGLLFEHLLVSFSRVFTGFIITFFAAFFLAVILGLNDELMDYLNPILEFIRHIPPIALIPILILWFGIGEKSKLAVIILATFFPIFFNTLSGIKNCDRKLLEVGDNFNLSEKDKFLKIIFPQALPSIIVGMQIGLGYSWRSLIGAELIASSSGIGYMIIDAEQLSRPDIILVGVFTIGIFGYLIDYIFIKLSSRYFSKRGEKIDRSGDKKII